MALDDRDCRQQYITTYQSCRYRAIGSTAPDLPSDRYSRSRVPRVDRRRWSSSRSDSPPLDWVTCRRVSNPAVVTALEVELDRREAQAITLSQELAADLLLIDEHLGRVVAARLGIKIIGLLGVLMEAKHQGLIPEIKALVDALMNHGFRIGNDLYVRVLEAAGEQEL